MTDTFCALVEMCDIGHKYGALTFVDEMQTAAGKEGGGNGEQEGVKPKIDIISGACRSVGSCIASTGALADFDWEQTSTI